MTAHIYLKHKLCDHPANCPICDGGLSVCTVCHGAEGSLPTECPGIPMKMDVQDAVYNGRLDFRANKWTAKIKAWRKPNEDGQTRHVPLTVVATGNGTIFIPSYKTVDIAVVYDKPYGAKLIEKI